MITKIRNKASLFLILMLCFILPQTVFAANEEFNSELSGQASYGILWVNTSSIDINLSFSGGNAICGAVVIGKIGTTEITANVVLARRNTNGTYTTVKTWSNLYATGNVLVFDGSYYVTTGYTYRLTITEIAYLNGISETVSSYIEKYAY